ncbi:TPA: hypothetical protein ACGCGJ_000998 [Stenotrophomonas maltophilia]|jgi:hypothetical protein|uniref:hypothetical protein n=1 Tax=Stenotrophomonas TaxID=40323 RepID=UPI0005B6CB64|nr:MULTISPECIES: hypothetical protein [Stenotrophomonas]KIS40467.1 hypothetical protein WJ66_01080 [Stenotrophomonas maltophilia WJ66]MBN4998644.1 hypothetical protein [Stenotrophomonas maltophilia]MBN5008223.1 hypothetical protein [Stenotrophomonas maltophilia]MCF3460313.1 hypothetical protein [Stenotrophomonas maltophilia]MCF3517262.1 hypothetical protein [Stenotrophomonas maltophilia]
MGDINRLRPVLLLSFALAALAACSQPGDPAQTVQRDTDALHAPAAPVSEAMQMQPTAPAEGVTRPEAVQLRRTSDGGVEIRKVDAVSGHGADTARVEPQQH